MFGDTTSKRLAGFGSTASKTQIQNVFTDDFPSGRMGLPYVNENGRVVSVTLLGRANTMQGIAGWWFGTFFIFPYIGNNHPK